MAIDPNEITGWIGDCGNIMLLRNFIIHAEERLGALGADFRVEPEPLRLKRSPGDAGIQEAARLAVASIPPPPSPFWVELEGRVHRITNEVFNQLMGKFLDEMRCLLQDTVPASVEQIMRKAPEMQAGADEAKKEPYHSQPWGAPEEGTMFPEEKTREEQKADAKAERAEAKADAKAKAEADAKAKADEAKVKADKAKEDKKKN